MVLKRLSRGTGEEEGLGPRRTLLFVTLGALCIGAAFLAAAILLASCAGSVSSLIRADGGAQVAIQAQIPPALSAKFRAFAAAGGSGSGGPSFDMAAIRRSIAARPGLSLIELAQPTPDSMRMVLGVKSLEELAAAPDIAGTGLLAYSAGQDWVECRIRIDHASAKTLVALFPGIDPRLMDALSPPALEEDPVSEAEYRSMLASILGSKAMPALDAAAIELSLTAPGEVLASGGGKLVDRTLTARLPAIRLLALERPVEIWLRWRRAQ